MHAIPARRMTSHLRRTLRLLPSHHLNPRGVFRSSSSTVPSPANDPSLPIPSRWLSDIQARIGHCITWGLQPKQIVEAARILQELARDWRQLLAGSEGFLTDPRRCGMFRQAVVWGEMDSMGHVNNVVYNRFAESSRVAWMRQIAVHVDPAHSESWSDLWKPRREGLLLRSIATHFKFPMMFPDRVTVYHRLAARPVSGADSISSNVLILSERHRRVAARCDEENVLYDYQVAKRVPFRPFMLDVLTRTWDEQEQARLENTRRVGVLLERVRALEQASWDREGAVEDMGTAD